MTVDWLARQVNGVIADGLTAREVRVGKTPNVGAKVLVIDEAGARWVDGDVSLSATHILAPDSDGFPRMYQRVMSCPVQAFR